MDKLRADMDAIEDSIAQGDMSAAQVFTQMKQMVEAASARDRLAPQGEAVNWLVWSNEHNAWWRPNARGYTLETTEAGRYTFDEARDICINARPRSGAKSEAEKAGDPPEVMVLAPESLGAAGAMDAVVTVANDTGMAHDEVIPTWPHYTDEDRKMFAAHPPLKGGDVMELHAQLGAAPGADQADDGRYGKVMRALAGAFAEAACEELAKIPHGTAAAEGTGLIPLDPSYTIPHALVTSSMKAACHGEFTIPVEQPEFDDGGDATGECVTVDVPVPWDTMKAIYKMMANEAMRGLAIAEQHPDDSAVDRFAAAMKAKLAKKRADGRGGWQTASEAHLSALLHEHVAKGDPVDVANLAMMLHQNGQRVAAHTQAFRGLGMDDMTVDQIKAVAAELADAAETMSGGEQNCELMLRMMPPGAIRNDDGSTNTYAALAVLEAECPEEGVYQIPLDGSLEHSSAPQVAVPDVVVTALESARDSLATYGAHPIIESHIAKALAMLAAAPTAPAGELGVTGRNLLHRAACALDAVVEFPDSQESMQDALHDAEDLAQEIAAWEHANPAPTAPAGEPNNSRALIDQIIEQLEKGFVVCNSCGDQEDTATLDVMDDLRRLRFLIAAASNRAAPDEREPAARALDGIADKIEKHAQLLLDQPAQGARRAAGLCRQEADRLRAGKEGETS